MSSNTYYQDAKRCIVMICRLGSNLELEVVIVNGIGPIKAIPVLYPLMELTMIIYSVVCPRSELKYIKLVSKNVYCLFC